MKLKKLLVVMLVLVMGLSTSVFAADFSDGIETSRTPIEVDFSIEGRDINVLSLDDGKLISYDEDGVKTVTYLSKKEIATKLPEIGIMSFDTGDINQYVPKNIDGNQGEIVGGSYYIVSPDNYVNLRINRLPQTTMPTINVAITNEIGDDSSWASNVPQGNLVYKLARFPNERYAVKVSTNEISGATGNMRAFTD